MKKGKNTIKAESKTGLKSVGTTSELIDVTNLSTYIRNLSEHPIVSEQMEYGIKLSAGKMSDDLYMIIADVSLENSSISDENEKVCAEFTFGFLFRIGNWSDKALEKQYNDEGLIPAHLKISLTDIVFGTIRGMLVVLLGDTMYNNVYFNILPKYDEEIKKL